MIHASAPLSLDGRRRLVERRQHSPLLIRCQHITSYTARRNGKIERYKRTRRGVRSARTWTSEQGRTDTLATWILHYNYHRPNSAYDRQPSEAKVPARVNNVLATYN